MRSHFGIYSPWCAFGWCGVMSIACDCIHQVKVWPTHNNLFVPNEFIVCIISQSLRYKRHFKTTFKSSKILAFVFSHFFPTGNSFVHQLLNRGDVCLCDERRMMSERAQNESTKNEMKWTHYCRCPLKWTCTQPTSVAIKQLKALLFFEIVYGTFNSWHNRAYDFSHFVLVLFLLKARVNLHTTFYIKLFVANGLWRSSFEFLFKWNEHRTKKRNEINQMDHIFFSIALCCARSTCHSKTIISSCKWATKSETNGKRETVKYTNEGTIALFCSLNS